MLCLFGNTQVHIVCVDMCVWVFIRVDTYVRVFPRHNGSLYFFLSRVLQKIFKVACTMGLYILMKSHRVLYKHTIKDNLRKCVQKRRVFSTSTHIDTHDARCVQQNACRILRGVSNDNCIFVLYELGRVNITTFYLKLTVSFNFLNSAMKYNVLYVR